MGKAYVAEEDYELEVARADRAAEALARKKEKDRATMHAVGHVLTATSTATAIGLGESYFGHNLTLAGVPVEAIIAFAGLTGGAMNVGGNTWSGYLGAGGTGAACVVGYKWAVDADPVAGDHDVGVEVGAKIKREPASPQQMRQGARVALPPGLTNTRSGANARGGTNAENDAKAAMRRLGLVA